MPKTIRPNPFSGRLLRELAVLAAKMATELKTPKKRTPTQREELAWRCQMLLDTIGQMINPDIGGTGIDGSEPVENIAQMFGDWYAKESEALRLNVLQRAAEYVLGKDAHKQHMWLTDHAGAYRTESELKAQLERLNSAHKDRQRKR